MKAESLSTQPAEIAVIALNSLGHIDLWNPGAAALLGWSAEEILGTPPPPSLILPRLWSAIPAAHDLTAKDGRTVTVQLAAAPRGDEGIIFVATPWFGAAAEEHDREAPGRFRDLLEAAPDAIIEVDAEGSIVLLNQVTEELFGYTRDQLLGRNVDILLPDNLAAMHIGHRAGYLANPLRRPMGHGYVLQARRSDGSGFPVEISLSPVRAGNTFRVTAIIRDVTARRRAEEEVRIANQQLELRSREAERANALKSEFLASMSHELRTPLHTILGFTELLQEEIAGPLNEKQQRFVRHLHNDSSHLLDLINDILDLSKIEAGKLDLRIESVDAADIVAETVAGMRATAKAKGILLENAVHGPLRVMADSVRLREILVNLLGNAIKFTPEGGSVIVESCRPLPETVEIAVADTGIGIAPEHQEAIFETFRQIGATTRGVREGTGLGLAIVRRLVGMHGGRIAVNSIPSAGSRFAFTIPADLSRWCTAPVILIIEKSSGGRELLCSYLDPLGIRTECAGSSEEGLAIARRLRPNAIILDVMLPGHTGWRLLEELRADAETRTLPILVTSVLDFEGRAIASGATGYLQKPLAGETVIRALREHLPSHFWKSLKP